jgi:hypothetical protein
MGNTSSGFQFIISFKFKFMYFFYQTDLNMHRAKRDPRIHVGYVKKENEYMYRRDVIRRRISFTHHACLMSKNMKLNDRAAA